MLGRRDRSQLGLFVAGSLEQLVPADHVLARVDRVLDFGWLHDEVADRYCANHGRPGIEPEVAVRLVLAGLLLGIVRDRKLMREAQVNIAIRWFIGYRLGPAPCPGDSLGYSRLLWLHFYPRQTMVVPFMLAWPEWPRPTKRSLPRTRTAEIHDSRSTTHLRQGLPMIGKLLGHTQEQTTARYVHLARDTVKASAARIGDSIDSDLDAA